MMNLGDNNKEKYEKGEENNEIKYEKMQDIALNIKLGKLKNIGILCGAGISTSCGIPDFRSEETGIFSNLEEYNLPYPEAMFDIEFFIENPLPFYKFSKKILKNVLKAKPSKTHCFMKLLADKKLLTRIYSQNIDGLEEKVGIDENLVCCVHGSLKQAYCIECHEKYDQEFIIKEIMEKSIPKCEKCNGYVKPSIVFYGEQLPNKFPECLIQDFNKIDLLIIMGTSLTVYPVSYVADLVKENTPRLLLNKTSISKILVKPENISKEIKLDNILLESDVLNQESSSSGLDRNVNNRNRHFQDIFYQDSCDNGCMKLAELLGWKDELDKLYNKNN